MILLMLAFEQGRKEKLRISVMDHLAGFQDGASQDLFANKPRLATQSSWMSVPKKTTNRTSHSLAGYAKVFGIMRKELV